jgi:hypothetical protein
MSLLESALLQALVRVPELLENPQFAGHIGLSTRFRAISSAVFHKCEAAPGGRQALSTAAASERVLQSLSCWLNRNRRFSTTLV